jgi:hypothetical protein
VVRLNGGPIDRILEGLGVSGVWLKLGRVLVAPSYPVTRLSTSSAVSVW